MKLKGGGVNYVFLVLGSFNLLSYLYTSTAGCSFQYGRGSGQCGPQCCTAPPAVVYLRASVLLLSPGTEDAITLCHCRSRPFAYTEDQETKI